MESSFGKLPMMDFGQILYPFGWGRVYFEVSPDWNDWFHFLWRPYSAVRFYPFGWGRVYFLVRIE